MLIEPTSAYNYQVGGSLSPYAPTYVMRQADRELYASIKESEFCYVLTPRQTGKSSLMLRTMLKLQQEDIACAAIDLTVLGGRDVNERQWYTAFVFELNNDFQLLNYSSLSDWLRKHELLSPVTLLREFVEQVILKQLDDKIVIFIDEIDSILGLPFENKYFFTWIRNCFNLRASKPEYQRLTFVMLGVATPSDLIQDKNVTPFNIGHAIHIEGIQVNEVWPLAKGLADICAAPHALLEEILVWTGGQPFLTQKLCKLAHYELSQSFNKQTDNHFSSANGVSRAQITRWVEDLVQRQVLEDWESKDEPTHLKTIRDRLLRNEKRAGRLLALYCQILAQGEVPVNNSIAQMELLLSGLVVKSLVSKQHSGPVLQSSNRIYAAVFDRCWVERELTELRPYAEAINAWLQSNCRDESRLLRGQALQSAMLWAKDKNLGDWDYRFLTASQAWDKSEVQRQLDAQKVANRILNAARRRAKWIYITCISAALLVIAFGIGTLRFFQQELEVAERGLRIEQQGFDILRKFESADLQALHFAMVLGQELKTVVGNRLLENYPSTSPLLALQSILENIRELNHFGGPENSVLAVKFISSDQLFLVIKKTVARNGAQQEHRDNIVQIWRLEKNKWQKVVELENFKHNNLDYVQFNPKELHLVTIKKSGIVQLWTLQGQKLAEFSENTDSILGIEFSPDGKSLASRHQKGSVRIWDLQGRQLAKFFGHRGAVLSVKFSSNGERLLTGGEDGTARLWNLEEKQLAVLAGHQQPVLDVSFSSRGEMLATAGEDGTARLWNLEGEQLAVLAGHQKPVLDVAFSPHGEMLATAGEDGTARLWNLEGKPLALLTGHNGKVLRVEFFERGSQVLLVTRGVDGTTRIWNLEGYQLAEFQGEWGPVWDIQFSPDRKRLVTIGADYTAKMWNLEKNRSTIYKAHQGKILDVEFSPDGMMLATSGEDGASIICTLKDKKLTSFTKHHGPVWNIEFSPDGKMLATAGEDRTARLWDSTGKQLRVFRGHQGPVFDVQFSPDGQKLITVGEDSTARLWNLQGKQLTVFQEHQGPVLDVEFSPDGQKLATATENGTVVLWNLKGKKLQELPGNFGPIWDLQFSPDGQMIATAGKDGTAIIWNLKGEKLNLLKGHHSQIWDMQFTNDGQRLATVGTGSTPILWSLERQRINLPHRENKANQDTHFNSHYHTHHLLVKQLDSIVQLWNLNGQKLAEFREDGAVIQDIQFSPDSKQIALARSDGFIVIRQVEDLDQLLTRGCRWLENYFLTHPEILQELESCHH